MKKRFLSILLALCMVTQFVPTAALAAQPDAVSNGTTTAMSTTETEQGPDQVADDGEDGTADNEGQTLNDEAIEDSTGGDGDSETALHNEEAINAVAEPGDGDNGTTGDGEETADALADCDFSVTGDASNYTWDEATGVLTITGGAVEVSNKDADAATSQRIYIQGTAHVTLAGVNIVSSAGAPIEIQDYGDTSVTLALEGANTLVSQAAEKAALHKSRGQQADGSQASTLTINGTGSLTATGGDTAAGIGGGGYHGDVHNITIDGGTISATGTGSGAGIGASYGGSTWNIVINGGNVTANGQPGIGASNWNGVRNANIAGGMVVANSYEGSTPTGGLVSTDSGKSYILRGDYTLSQDLTIASDGSLTVAEGAKLTVAEGATLTNEGTLTNDGTIDGSVVNEGTLVNDGAIAGPLVNDGSVYSKGTLPADMSGTGTVYRQHVTVNGGTGSGNYDAGSPVTITADAPEDGKMFTGWTVELGGVALADSSQAQTTFTMPDGCAIVTANYAEVVAAVTDASGNTTYYGDSYAAREAWRSSGGTLTVYSDSFEFSGYSDLIPSNGVLDLNGHSISSFYLSASNGTITIKNGTLKDRVFCSIFSGARVTFEDVAIERGDQTLPYGLYIYNEGTIISNGLALENGITIEGSGSVTGDVKTALTDSMFTLDGIPDEGFVFDGTSHVPSVKCGDATLTENTDYTVTLSNSTGGDSAVNAGTVTVKITGTGSYGGTVTKTYEIAKQSIDPGTDPENPNPDYKGVTISDPSNVVYNGTEQKWAPEVKDAGDAALVADSDYTVAYSSDVTNVGTVTVTIQGIGNYTGTVTKNYEITNHGHKVCGEESCTNDKHGDELPWTAWTDTANLPNIPGNYYLANNVALTATWTCNVDINLCLNGKSITGSRGEVVIKVVSGGSLSITDCGTTGKITHNSGATGRGIFNDGALILWNGSIAGNTTNDEGGGVFNSGTGTFNMYGGSITNCTAKRDNPGGGGVFNSTGGAFNMYGGKISSCAAARGGGVFNNENSTFNMYGGSITNCTASTYRQDSLDGGGVCSDGTFNMTGGYITNCTASTSGGGVYNWGPFAMSGGAITGNAAPYGGGVCHSSSFDRNFTFTMSGGEISGNTASTNGGGVFDFKKNNTTVAFIMTGGKIIGCSANCGGGVYNNSACAFIMTGGGITSNNATTNGGGVYNDDTFNASGNPVISGNVKGGMIDDSGNLTGGTANNVYLSSGKAITVDTATGMDEGAGVGITGTLDQTVVSGTTSTTGFYCDNAGYKLEPLTEGGATGLKLVKNIQTHCVCGDAKCAKTADGHESVTWQPWDGADGTLSYNDDNTAYVYLTQDVTRSDTFTVAEGKTLYLCLNGQGITGPDGKDVIAVASGASLAITDCGATGTIAHAENATGRGINNNGVLTLWNGSIAGNSADRGGGVNNDGGTFTMHGGRITGNNARSGGGVYVASGTFRVSGTAKVAGNFKGSTADDVYLTGDSAVIQSNGLEVGASVGIADTLKQTVVTGTASTTGFFSDNADYSLVGDSEKNVIMLVLTPVDISGVKLLDKAGGTEMTNSTKVYDGEAVAYNADAVVCDPDLTGMTLTYTWQKLQNGEYKDISGNAAPSNAGSYRLLVTATKDYKTHGMATYDFTITQKSVTATITAENKTYDGGTTAKATATLSGVVGSDDVAASVTGATFADKNVGTGKEVTASIELAGTAKGNYQLASATATVTAAIVPKALTIDRLVIAEKYYDGTNKARFMAKPVLVGVVGDEKATLVNGVPTFTSVSVGRDIPISFTEFKLDGADAGNYTLAQPTGITGDISAYIPSSKEYATTTSDWTNQDFVVAASSGWLVSETNTAEGTWSDRLTRSAETGSAGDRLTFYVKNAKYGYISEAITKTYRIDKTAPTIKGADCGKTYCGPVELTVADANLDKVTVNGEAVEPAADEAMVLAADAPAELAFTVQPAEGEQTVVATDMAGNATTLKLTVNNGHTWGAWSPNGDGTHTHACEYGDSTETAECHGGAATCSDRAVCDDCGQAYGEVDTSNHAALTHVDAKAATATAEGNIEYWHCEACGKYFADAAGEKEIQQADTVVAKEATVPDGDKGDSTASKTDDDKAGDEEPGKSQVSRTGDSTVAAWPPAILGAAALAAVLVSARRRRS